MRRENTQMTLVHSIATQSHILNAHTEVTDHEPRTRTREVKKMLAQIRYYSNTFEYRRQSEKRFTSMRT